MPFQLWMARKDQSAPNESDFEEIRENNLPIKPKGGLWTSTYTPQEKYPSDWLRWCGQDCWVGAGREAYLLEPKEEVRIIEVDGLDDLRSVTSRFAREDLFTASTGTTLIDYEIDFRQMAGEGYDGLRLTEEGQAETRMTGPKEPDLYGWDSESTIWFSFAFKSVDYLGTASVDGKRIK